MSKEIKHFVIKSSPKIRCYCNEENCFSNKTCETDGFCYQNLIVQIKNGRTIKKFVKGCSTSKHIDFYYVSILKINKINKLIFRFISLVQSFV